MCTGRRHAHNRKAATVVIVLVLAVALPLRTQALLALVLRARRLLLRLLRAVALLARRTLRVGRAEVGSKRDGRRRVAVDLARRRAPRVRRDRCWRDELVRVAIFGKLEALLGHGRRGRVGLCGSLRLNGRALLALWPRRGLGWLRVEEIVVLRRVELLLLLGIRRLVGHSRNIGLGRARICTLRRLREVVLRAIGCGVHALLGVRVTIGIMGLWHVLLILVLGVSLIHGDRHALHLLLVTVGHRGRWAGLCVAVSRARRCGGWVLLSSLREALSPGVVDGDTPLLLLRYVRGIIEHGWCAEHGGLGGGMRRGRRTARGSPA
ncbi:hypothetical protein C8Q72DRAFT_63736 [Fomitopsis betulina]|nr:hypothetical protein C8Q72DRAFT_63736 [Fomitopsis betulina]